MPRWRRLRVWVLGTAALAALGACSEEGWLGLPEPATDQADWISSTWFLFTVAALVVGGLVWGLIFFVLLRYRRRSDELPDQRRYNIPVEIAYTVAPLLVVIGLFVFSTFALGRVQASSPDADITVVVTAYQWGWTFDYPDHGVTVDDAPDTAPTMVLPVDTSVRFVLRADDVVHSFYVPNFLYKQDMFPGDDTTFEVVTNRQGVFPGRCAEFCGLLHHAMDFTVEIVDAGEFEEWVSGQGGAR